MPYSSTTKISRRLVVLAQRRRDLQQEIRDTVAMARADDLDGKPMMMWWEIAHNLGVSKQAAQQRYGARLVD